MTVLHLRGVVLPEGAERDLYVDDDRLTFEPVPGAQTVVSGGWLVPGLVDVHNHPGAFGPGAPLQPQLLRAHADAQREAGVLAVRSPGAADRLPDWYGGDPGTPRVLSAGRWVAVEGRFFRGWGVTVSEEEVPAALEAEARAGGGWAKLVPDWSQGRGEEQRYTPSMSPEVIATAIARAHAAGARVAVHAQCRETAEAAVLAGVDSVEHGLHLPEDLLELMARQGTALVPTLLVMSDIPAGLVRRPRPQQMAELLRRGWERLPRLTAAAYEAGVTVLAGTDVLPQAPVWQEVRHLRETAGLPAEAALGAASWVAREFLGLPGLVEGGLADVVAFDRDPRRDLSVLAEPSRVVLRGRVVR